MKTDRVIAVFVIAVTTMALTLAVLGPRRVEAVDQDPEAGVEIRPVISQPMMEIAGLQVKLMMDQDQYAPGDEPVVTLIASNPTDQRVEANVWIGMTASGVEDLMSRAPSLPTYFWSESRSLAIEPGAKERIQLQTNAKLAAGKLVSVTMSDSKQRATMAKLLQLNRGVAERRSQLDDLAEMAPSGRAAR